MEKNEVDNVGNKLDNINEAIHRLINDLNISRSRPEGFSLISPIHSFSENLMDFHDFHEFSFHYPDDSQHLIDKFHEMLTENDRLHMQVEDLTEQISRNTDPTFEIFLSKEKIQALNKDTEKFMRENVSHVILKIKKDSFIIESSLKPERISYFTGQIQSRYFDRLEREKKEKEEMEAGVQIIQMKAELEAKIVALAKKQQKTMELEENLGCKIQALELIKMEYYSKLQELERKSENHETVPFKSKRTCSCSDQTEVSYFSEPISFNTSISKMLNSLERATKIGKESILEDSLSKDITIQYNHNKKLFTDSLQGFGRFSNKEVHLLNYFKEQSILYDEKFRELNEYEKYLQETWVDTLGNQQMVSALHKASQQNFKTAKILKKEREVIEEKTMRLEKIKQLIEEESKRLEFHRKKILNERQVLLNQQSDVESALEKIMNFRL